MKRTALFTLLLLVLVAAPAAAEDNFTSLDEVDTGETESLDEVDTGETESLDEVDTGRTESLGSVDDGRMERLGKVDTGRTESLDEVDTGRTYGLDEAEFGTIEDRPAPAPRAEFAGPLSDEWENRLRVAYGKVVSEDRRYQEADRAFIVMRRTRFPTGDARAEIVREYRESHRALEQANARYTDLVAQAKRADRVGQGAAGDQAVSRSSR